MHLETNTSNLWWGCQLGLELSVMGSNWEGTDHKIFQAVGTVQRKATPERGGCSYRRIGQEDGLLAKWIGA